MNCRVLAICVVAIAMTLNQVADAHFPWLTVRQDGNVVLFFGETPADRNYKMPASIAKAQIERIDPDGETFQIEVSPVDQNDFVGLESDTAVPRDAFLATKATYGVYHGARLDYYALHQGGVLPTQLGTVIPVDRKAPLNARVVDSGEGVDVYVTWNGKPLADAKVQLYCDEGHEEGVATTDAAGKVAFNQGQVESGLNGIVVGHNVKGETGQVAGQDYESVSHYLTLTFFDPNSDQR